MAGVFAHEALAEQEDEEESSFPLEGDKNTGITAAQRMMANKRMGKGPHVAGSEIEMTMDEIEIHDDEIYQGLASLRRQQRDAAAESPRPGLELAEDDSQSQAVEESQSVEESQFSLPAEGMEESQAVVEEEPTQTAPKEDEKYIPIMHGAAGDKEAADTKKIYADGRIAILKTREDRYGKILKEMSATAVVTADGSLICRRDSVGTKSAESATGDENKKKRPPVPSFGDSPKAQKAAKAKNSGQKKMMSGNS